MKESESSGLNQIKEEVRKNSENQWRALGNLSEEEIKELSGYEGDVGLESVNSQVRRYYLKVKIERPDKAEKMLEEIGLIDETILTDADAQMLCDKLCKYISGIVINYNGKIYGKGGGGPLRGEWKLGFQEEEK